MIISDDIKFGILKFFNGLQMEKMKFINSTFNQLINQFFISTPTIQYMNFYYRVEEKMDDEITIISDNGKETNLNLLKNQRLRIEYSNIYLNSFWDESHVFDYLNEIKHLWINQNLTIKINTKILLDNFAKIFTNLAKNCKYLHIYNADDCLKSLPKEIIIKYLESNYGVELYLKDSIIIDKQMSIDYGFEIYNELKKV